MFLLALFLLGGMCWLDTFDLSDDIPLSQPLTVVQQAIEPDEESREDLLGLVHGQLAVWFVASFVPQPPRLFVSVAPSISSQSDPPLYQRISIYRI
ncbi:MAG TPA: hypothetical protein VE201_08345 [Nitrospirales bacterium]|nr:hypothetical protein [Nitrospirales bacterium]